MRGRITKFTKLTSIGAIGASKDKLKAILRTPLYSNAFYIMLANAANVLFGLVFWKVTIIFYTTDDIGLGSAVLSAASLIAAFSGLGFSYVLVRFLRSSRNPNKLTNTCFTVVGSISVVVALIFVLGLGIWVPRFVFIRQNAVYFAAFVLFASAATLSGLADQAFVANRRAGFITVRYLVFNVVRLILIVSLASILHSFGIFASWGMAMFVSFALGIFLFLPRIQSGYRPSLVLDRESVSGKWRFSIANYFSDVLSSAPSYILPLLVVSLLSATSNAYFYIAWTLGSTLAVIPSAVAMSLFAEGSHEEGRMGWHISRSVKMISLILVPAVVFVVALADKLLWLFKPEYAQNAATLLRLVAVASLPMALSSVYFSIKRVEKKLKPVILLVFLSGALTIGLSYVLMHRLGINGVGVAWLVSQCCVALCIVADWLGDWLKAKRMAA